MHDSGGMIGFREAAEADLPAIVALLADGSLAVGREDPGPPLPECYVAGFRAMMARGSRIVVAVEGGVVVGCLQLDILPGVSQRGMCRAQVEGVRVAASHRGRGIGEALMREAMDRARAAGAGAMQLTTNRVRTDAQRFYTRLGFTASHVGMKLGL